MSEGSIDDDKSQVQNLKFIILFYFQSMMSNSFLNMNTGNKSLKKEIENCSKLLHHIVYFQQHLYYIRQLLHRGQRLTLSTAPNIHPQWLE